MCDGSYQDTQQPQDHHLSKLFYYKPYGGHIIKTMFLCSAAPKVNTGCLDKSVAFLTNL